MTSLTADATVDGLPEASAAPSKPGYNKWFGRICLILAALLILVGAQIPADAVNAEHAAAEMIAEFNPEAYLSIPKIGPIDLSITKPVLYMWMVAFLCCGFAAWQAHRMRPKPNRKQTFVETMYDFVYSQIGKSTLPDNLFNRFMPYLASVFLFIWLMNLISFLPLPFGSESFLSEKGLPGIRDLGLYAATSNINITITLTVVTLTIVHVLGVREHGVIGYLKSWAPPGGLFLKIFMWGIHALGELVKVVSLSVRLFANMLTGHMLILVMFTIIFVMFEQLGLYAPFVGLFTVPVAVVFFLFEVGLVATLQAYIFAVLSGSYMGMAASHDH